MSRYRFPMPKAPMVGIDGKTLARNGTPAYASSFQRIAQIANGLSARRGRVLAQMEWGNDGSTTASGLATIWEGVIKTSHAFERARFVATAAPVNSTSLADIPLIRLTVGLIEQDVSDSATRDIYINVRDTTAKPDQSTYQLIQTVVDPITFDTESSLPIVSDRSYWFRVATSRYARLKNFVLFEEQLNKAYLSHNFVNIRPISFQLYQWGGATSFRTLVRDNTTSYDESFIGATCVITGAPLDNDGTYQIVGRHDEGFWIDNAAGGTGSTGAAQTADSDTRFELRDKIIMTPSVRVASPITTVNVQELSDHNRDIWKRSGGRLFDWSDAPNTLTPASTSYEEVHSQSTGADNQRLPGHTVYPEKMGTYESTNVPCVAWINCDNTDNIDCEFRTSDGTVLCTFTSKNRPGVVENDGFHTETFNLDSSQTDQKVHIWVKQTTGSTTPGLRGYGAYQWEDDDQPVTPLSIFGGASVVEWWFRCDFGVSGFESLGVDYVTQWLDKSGNAVHLTAASGNEPIWDVANSTIGNYRPIYFNSSGQQFDFPSSTASPDPMWIFAVYKNLDANSGSKIHTLVRIKNSPSTDRPFISIGYTGAVTNPHIYDGTSGDRLAYSSARTKWTFLEAGARTAGSTLRSLTATYWDQFSATGPAATETNTSGSFAAGQDFETIGYNMGGATWGIESNFYLAEIFCVNVTPSSDQLDDIRNYAIGQWGWP